jgi:anti-anti-sigma factor
MGARRAKPNDVRLSGEFDIARLMELRYSLARTVSGDAKNLVIDLGGVTFMCAGTVGVLVRTRALLSARGRTLTLRGATGCVQRVLSICGVG